MNSNNYSMVCIKYYVSSNPFSYMYKNDNSAPTRIFSAVFTLISTQRNQPANEMTFLYILMLELGKVCTLNLIPEL